MLLFHCLLQNDVQTRLKSYKTRRRICFCCPFYFTSKVASSAGSMVGSISSRPRSSRLSLRSRDVRTDSTGTDSPLSNRNSRPIEDKVEGRRSVIQQRLSTLNAITEEEPDSGSPRTRSAPPPRRSVLIPPTNVNGLTPPRFRDQRNYKWYLVTPHHSFTVTYPKQIFLHPNEGCQDSSRVMSVFNQRWCHRVPKVYPASDQS